MAAKTSRKVSTRRCARCDARPKLEEGGAVICGSKGCGRSYKTIFAWNSAQHMVMRWTRQNRLAKKVAAKFLRRKKSLASFRAAKAKSKEIAVGKIIDKDEPGLGFYLRYFAQAPLSAAWSAARRKSTAEACQLWEAKMLGAMKASEAIHVATAIREAFFDIRYKALKTKI